MCIRKMLPESPRADVSSTTLQNAGGSKQATRLFPYKLTYAFFNGSHAAIPAYLAVYLREIGCSPVQIGVILSPMSLAGFCGGIFCGFLTLRHLAPASAFTLGIMFKLTTVAMISFVPPPRLSDGIIENCSALSVRPNASGLGLAPVEKSWIFDQREVDRNVVLLTTLSCLLCLVYAGNHGLLDSMTLAALGETRRNEYGRQRKWGTIAHGSFSIMCGALATKATWTVLICRTPVVFIDYHLVFYVFLALTFLTVVTSRYLGDSPQRAEENEEVDSSFKSKSTRDYAYLLNLDIVVWLFVTFTLSNLFGVSQGYLFWHMENLGASPLLIGTSVAVKLVAEFCTFEASSKVLRTLGYNTVMGLCLVIEAGRMALYAVVTRPGLMLLIQAVDGISYSLIKSSQVTFCGSVSAKEDAAAMQSLFGAVICLGIGSGSLIGGQLTQLYGAPIAFVVFAGLALVTSLFFAITQGCLHHRVTLASCWSNKERLCTEQK